jgi:hypothetical protein
MRKATVTFAEIRLAGNQPICDDFPRALPPWPTLNAAFSIDGSAVPRGWEYTVAYWIENGAHHLEIPRSSRGIRNLAFLGEDDELVVVVPVPAAEFVWASSQSGPTATLQANILWRTRPDGTRG